MSKETPIRIQRSRQHKQVSPNGLPIVYVGRPSKWGNPYKIGDQIDLCVVEKVVHKIKMEDIYDVLLVYQLFVKTETGLSVEELKGKNLSCWCEIGQPCHADILLKMANNLT